MLWLPQRTVSTGFLQFHTATAERAQYVKACLEKLARFKKIVIVDTAGISSMYANDGGIIIAV